jgi:putative DNA primase/helicase
MNKGNIIKDKNSFLKTAETFFEKIFGKVLENGYGEIELRNFKGVSPTQYFCSNTKDAAQFAYNICNMGVDIYFGVNSRVGKEGKKVNVHYLNAFHAEIDFGSEGHNKPPEYKDGKEATQAIINFPLQPTYTNLSGGGFHCYWVLKDPIKVADVGVEELESINRYFLKALKADTGTHNLDRVLRVPGTYNFKLNKPRLVNVFDCNGPLYNFEDLKQYMIVDEPKKKTNESSAASKNPVPIDWDESIEKLPVSDKMKKLILNGNDGSYPTRSETDSAVVTALIHKGFEKSQISQIFANYPIGDKYREQKSPENYLQHTIENAKKYSNLTDEELQDPLFIADAITKDDKGNYGFNIVNFVEYIVKKYKFKYFEKEKAFFQYNDYCYQQISDEQLNFLCQSELKGFKRFFPKSVMVNFIHFSIGSCLINSLEAYDHQKRFLTLKNGLYDLNKEELVPHDPSVFTTNLLPYEYDPNAKCPLWEKFLSDVFFEKQDVINFVKQAVGYSFLKDIPTAALFLLIGEGSNGKSVFINTTTNLFGEENVANVNLHQMSDEYYIQDLFGKMVNLSAESSYRKRIDTEIIKAAVAGDWISGRLPYKPPSKFKPYAKHFLSINKIPKSDDLSYGWERRIYPIEFNRLFAEKDADKQMTNKLKLELSGIFNWALEGYRSLRGQDYVFIESASINQAKQNYKNQSNSVHNFIASILTKSTDANNIIPLKDVYDKYKNFCDSEGEKMDLTKPELKKVLIQSGYPVKNSTKHGNAVCVFGAISRGNI